MKKCRLLVLPIFFTVLISSCKVTQKTTDKNTQTPSDTATTDTLQVKTDTLGLQLPLDPIDSVELDVYRVLKDTVSIIGVGDIMMGTNFPNTSYLPPVQGSRLFTEVDTILRKADVTFGNLEGVILDSGGKQKYCKNPKVCYLFRTPNTYVKNLVDAGFDVVSTANNHAGDFGNEGRKNTMKVLDSLRIKHAGLLTNPYCTFKSEGMKYGFAAFSPNTGTVSINDIENAKSIISHLDSISDIVIVSFHGGAEGSKYQHVTRKTEQFYGENRGNVHRFSHSLIDAGADIVFGHGPHVTRAVEIYKKRFIAYSLGNFCTYARFNLQGANALAPIVKIFTNPNGEFFYGKITPVIQFKPGGPQIDPQKRVIKKIRELTEKDFPEVPIKIDDSGIISYIDN